MRSNGHVRFIRVSSRLQKRVAAGVVLLALAWAGSLMAMAAWRVFGDVDRNALLQREARVEKAENRVSAYRRDMEGVAQDLNRRQDFIEKTLKAHLGDLPNDRRAGETVSDSQTEAARAVNKISAQIPEAAGLARMEARQLAFVEGLTRYADRRAAATAAQIRRLGLNPDTVLATRQRDTAMGGPFIPLFSTREESALDPRFRRLGASLARMSALDEGLRHLPQVLPASLEFISSGFGYRSDPFNGRAAFHAGLDFRGPIGAPIYAAAAGTVAFAGVRQGYGNCIEVAHGNGLITRYAHMSRFRARMGQRVAGGEVIGAIGSTGRSTGPHLHFEVRINDRPVNPRPFLETKAHVPEKVATDHAAAD
ncbi:peptidoglycan DD-metalloendopeptidase family protein [Novosphingobium sp. FSY-8]|uniref:Peptidoglycan DD-metalloendopeptidase family protein n=2 Tax=Novosphingobium ovatum TaxID=1908523 RepID=A0ABW9XHD6_9SPHN|nr:peptidoglycan DD-metalloendopeptidase family protein [Novosphingobium ovatum]